MTASDRIKLPGRHKTHLEVRLPPEGGHADQVHLLSTREIHAVNAAIAAGRPLLVRGEPGIGKSQLARAAAVELRRPYLKYVIDSSTESHDLMWTFDAVTRLADAQLAGARRQDTPEDPTRFAVENYLHPGPLWWAFDWDGAQRQCDRAKGRPPAKSGGADPANGCVFLLDEIDKAESEVPNGLLEALGAREFTPMGQAEPVRVTGRPPLVVITTNEERVLPDAFLRRCFILLLDLPKAEAELTEFLMERGRAHFPDLNEALLRKAAEMLFRDRQEAIRKQVQPRPGQAEYLDLLRAVRGLGDNDTKRQREMLDIVAEYTLRKHAGPSTAD